MTSASEGGTVSFARPIRLLFRAKDRHSMRPVFHLFDYFNVANHADAIAGALRSGKIPGDGAWPASDVQTFRGGSTRASTPSPGAVRRDR